MNKTQSFPWATVLFTVPQAPWPGYSPRASADTLGTARHAPLCPLFLPYPPIPTGTVRWGRTLKPSATQVKETFSMTTEQNENTISHLQMGRIVQQLD